MTLYFSGVDCDKSRSAEVDTLLSDARNWAANGYVEVRDMNGGTPLHVAAAKGYIDVSNLKEDILPQFSLLNHYVTMQHHKEPAIVNYFAMTRGLFNKDKVFHYLRVAWETVLMSSLSNVLSLGLPFFVMS